MMNVVDGRQIDSRLERECDVVIVGSGPAGATVAKHLAENGLETIVVERGAWHEPDEFPEDMYTALAEMFRDMAAAMTSSWPPIPMLQGVTVGGSSVVNGAICWRLPEFVHEEWCADDPALREGIPWEQLQADFDDIEEELSVGPTDYDAAGRHNQLFATGADALGLEHKPTDLNVRHNCGHGLRGCPQGNKMSMDRTYLPDFCAA
ncbi:MAG: GMC family oxidoreductase N-terminal domain-containing protein, partial [Myxococcota bacterium]